MHAPILTGTILSSPTARHSSSERHNTVWKKNQLTYTHWGLHKRIQRATSTSLSPSALSSLHILGRRDECEEGTDVPPPPNI